MQPVVIGDVLWEPTPEVIGRSRLKRFMDSQGVESFPELLRRSTSDLEWFWDATVHDLGIHFYRGYERVLDLSDGIQWARWFPGAKMNIVATCPDTWMHTPSRDKPALIWEGEPGEVRRLTYGELHDQVGRFANVLTRLGVARGDRVGVLMPMTPEVAITVLACAKLGALFIPLFSGYGSGAIADRLNDGEAKVLVCADGFHRISSRSRGSRRTSRSTRCPSRSSSGTSAEPRRPDAPETTIVSGMPQYVVRGRR